jgi:FAD/FMN-containing dehydrogenase/Fe-S oxidoreductase
VSGSPGRTPDDPRSFRWTVDPPARRPGDGPIDIRGLAADLAGEIEGEVLFDAGERALYATDASNYRQVPIGVVRPRHAGDVEAAVAVCRRHGAPLLGRGGGTSLAGQCCNAAVVLDLSRHMHRILEVDPERRLARVEPGVILDHLRHRTEPLGLTFGPDPATHDRCTLGGMIGNDSCGVHSVMAGRTIHNVRALDVLTYDGTRMRLGATGEPERRRILARGGRPAEIVARLGALAERYGDLVRERFPAIPRRVSGYALDALLPENGFHMARSLVGSEGTCALILEATLELVPWPARRVLLVAGFEDVAAAADAAPELLRLRPAADGAGGLIGLEGFDARLIEDQRRKGIQPEGHTLLPPGTGWLLIELGGATRVEAAEHARQAESLLAHLPGYREGRRIEDPAEQGRLWAVRESGLGATARVPGRAPSWAGWEDSAVAPERMGAYLRDLRRLYDRYGYHGAFYGHFGDGCLHTRIDFDLGSRPGIEAFRSFLDEAADLVIAHGGSLSGEHGDGQARAELLPKLYGEELCRAFSDFKAAWDPDDRMNPGKLARPYPITSNLRLGGPDGPFHPRWEPDTRFAYPGDGGRLSRAVLRCVGVGKCRRTDGGVMCPSYMVTREERHSTRGRARLLFEMLQGEVITDRWRSAEVREALDLCLSCKACRHECPVQVDMATYKAEFLFHHHAGRLRPRIAYATGLVRWWLSLASAVPGVPALVNRIASGRFTGRLLKALGGIAPERPLPALARRPFRKTFRRRRGAPGTGSGADSRPRVVLWPDTFHDHFLPEVLDSAVTVLEAAGFEVVLPPAQPGGRPGGLCCGRPLYDHGFLGLAERTLRTTVAALRDEIRAGTPVVGLEPSCVAVFRDELPNLLPDDPDAHRLSGLTLTLAELLERHADRWREAPLGRAVPSSGSGSGPVLVHAHCHHRAVMGLDADRALWRRLGLDVRVLDAGCCGMAGAFGYDPDKLAVSLACAERGLAPEVRAADEGTPILADGFSCRTQIEQTTGRRPLHLAELLAELLADLPTGFPASRPAGRPPRPPDRHRRA